MNLAFAVKTGTRIRRLFPALAVLFAMGCGPASDDSAGPDANLLSAADAAPSAKDLPETVAFFPHVAPVIWDHCTPCHRPGQSGPFPLIDYDDVRKRARQIVEVTQSGYMPPWLPAPCDVPYEAPRRLTALQKSLLNAWVDGGSPRIAPETDTADPMTPPEWPEGWQLGTPDAIVAMPAPYELPAEGADVYRNFVIPFDAKQDRWVRAIEFKPRNPRVIHHAVIMIDPTQGSRQLEAATGEPGFGGDMSVADARLPGGQFFGWTPGRQATQAIPGTAWRWTPGTDFVVQLHMRPAGKPVIVQPTLGLYFTDDPPTRHPYPIVLRNKDIDIAAGDPSYRLRQSYVLPVDVVAYGVYPHAHYLATTMKGTAVLPDGTTILFLQIPRWDFNWQDEYRFAEPLPLPRGTRLIMDYTYDNSADNPLNPNSPPVRVTFGQESSDEMGELMLQVLVGTADDRALLASDIALEELRKDADRKRDQLNQTPDDQGLRLGLGRRLLQIGQANEAISQFQIAASAPDTTPEIQSAAYLEIGNVMVESGDLQRAAQAYQLAVQADPNSAVAHFQFGDTCARLAFFDPAIEHLEKAEALNPDFIPALNALAKILATHPDPAQRQPGRAIELATRAANASNRANPIALDTLAIAHAAAGDFERAVSVAQEALTLARQNGQTEWISRLQDNLERFQSRQPFR